MSEWVLDCSAALALALADEDCRAVERLLGGMAAGEALWVPPLFWSELGNALEMARRRGRLPEAAVAECLALLERLPLKTDWLLGLPAARLHRRMAAQHDLTAYDASYLELAERRGLGLATLDHGLAEVASRCGISVLAAS